MSATGSEALRSFAPRVARSGGFALAIGALAVSWAGFSHAAPQGNLGLAPGLCVQLDEGACFALAGRGDVMFGRTRATELGWGPAFELGTFGFDDVRTQLGASVHVPASALDLVFTGAPYWRFAAASEPGMAARAMVGWRGYNYGSNYVAAGGLLLGLDWGLGDERERVVSVALHLDAMWLSLPWVLLASLWFGGD